MKIPVSLHGGSRTDWLTAPVLSSFRRIAVIAGLLLAVSRLAAHAVDSVLYPSVLADFAEGEPALTIGPGEKRLVRSWRSGDRLSYTKPPYDAYPGKRISVKESVVRDPKGGYVLEPKGDLTANVLGGMNLARGTVASWFRRGEESGPLLSLRGFPLRETPYPLKRMVIPWQLGIEKEGKKRNVYLATPGGKWVANVVPNEEWLHIAAVWDENHGAKIYINGEVAADDWKHAFSFLANHRSTVDNPLPADRLQIHALKGGGLRDLRVYDTALSADGINALFKGTAPRAEWVESSSISRPCRLASLGWDQAAIDPLLRVKPGTIKVVRQGVITEAKENRRAAGWLAVSGFVDEGFPSMYHGYTQGVERQLIVGFEGNFSPNWMVGSGEFKGTLQIGNGEKTPFLSKDPWFGKRLDAASLQAPKLVFGYEKGFLSNLSFYHISDLADEFPSGAIWYALQEAKPGVGLSPWKERQLVSVYPPECRLTFAAASALVGSSTRRIPALTPFHLVVSPGKDDFLLGEIGLRLVASGITTPTRLRVVAHDPFSPWRELMRADFLLEPGGDGAKGFRLLFDLRDTRIGKDEAVWVTLTFEHDIILHLGEGGQPLGSMLPKIGKRRWRFGVNGSSVQFATGLSFSVNNARGTA